jgi:MFS family permease
MPYVAVLLIIILVSFTVVRIGAFALQLTGMGPEVARFQALSAFSGTGFTTSESERVVRNRARRRIISVLIVLGNAGMVTMIGTLVVSFTQVTGYGWFFIRLAMIIVGIFVLYRIILRSKFGNRILYRLRKPLMERILKEAPFSEEIYRFGQDWGINLVLIYGGSKNIGLSLADITAKEDDVEILAIDRSLAFLPRPDKDEKIMEGDRLLVYGAKKSVDKLFDGKRPAEPSD